MVPVAGGGWSTPSLPSLMEKIKRRLAKVFRDLENPNPQINSLGVFSPSKIVEFLVDSQFIVRISLEFPRSSIYFSGPVIDHNNPFFQYLSRYTPESGTVVVKTPPLESGKFVGIRVEVTPINPLVNYVPEKAKAILGGLKQVLEAGEEA